MKNRNTIQKIKIIEYLKNSKEHPNAEQIYKAIKEEIPTITLATVYRNLNEFVDKKLILRFKINDEFKFDGEIKSHQHCICKKCGKIIDNYQVGLNKYIKQKFNSESFSLEEVNIFYSGLCNECK
jgi:Fur family transcriptional regulator, peroxide stress response regulator